jgi:hypothetical protein
LLGWNGELSKGEWARGDVFEAARAIVSLLVHSDQWEGG